MINAVNAGQQSHDFIYNGWEVSTNGNPLCHTILRGAVDKYGKSMSNYHYEDLMRVIEFYNHTKLQCPACIVDANHSNSGKKWDQQPRIVKEVLHSRHLSEDIHNLVKGVMIESYLEDGRQEIGEFCYGKSITDPCLGWEKSEKLIYEIAERV